MEIKIEKNIPVPLSGRNNNKYPVADMEIGDSFFIPGKKTSNVHSCLTKYKAMGRKFKAMTLDGGVRVWRIS